MPNRHPLPNGADRHVKNFLFITNAAGARYSRSKQLSVASVLANWAALVALWALPYLTLLERLHIETAQLEILQWSLLIVGALGLASVLFTAWGQILDPAWRHGHGFSIRKFVFRKPTTPTAQTTRAGNKND